MHTLMIKGINPNISPEKAQNGIGKVFALRFGARNILKIQVFRPIQKLHQYVEKRKKALRKLKKVKKANHNNPAGRRELLQVGSKLTFNQRAVDAEAHLTQTVQECDDKIKQIQQECKKQNLGFAFISFKNKDCVLETIDEIELVRQNLMSDQKVLKLGIKDWQVQEAYPPTDIIWSEIHHLAKNNSFCKPFCIYALVICVSVVLLTLLLCLDR